MAIALVSSIFDLARAEAGVGSVSAASPFSDTNLLAIFKSSWNCLIKGLLRHSSPKLRRDFYYYLPAGVSRITPASIGISNIAFPQYLWDRAHQGILTPSALTLQTSAYPTYADFTVNSHGRTGTDDYIIYRIDKTSNESITADSLVGNLWPLEAADANTLRAWGYEGAESFDADIRLAYSSDVFPDRAAERLNDQARLRTDPSAAIHYWTWTNNVIRFQPLSQARQIRLTYFYSPPCPTSTSDSIGIEGADNFLALHLAATAIASLGADQRSSELYMRATGHPAGDAESVNYAAGELGAIAALDTRNLQLAPVQIIPWRFKRNTSGFKRW